MMSRKFVVIIVSLLAINALLFPANVYAKSCASEDILLLARQGFSKTEIDNICDGKSVESPVDEKDQISKLIAAMLSFETAEQAERFVYSYPSKEGLIGINGSADSLYGAQGNYSTYVNLRSGGMPAKYNIWTKVELPANSMEVYSLCDKYLKEISRHTAVLATAPHLERENAPRDWGDELTHGNRDYTGQLKTGAYISLQCGRGSSQKYENKSYPGVIAFEYGVK